MPDPGVPQMSKGKLVIIIVIIMMYKLSRPELYNILGKNHKNEPSIGIKSFV